ncbi:hypothetical protein P9J64_04825 [Deltaproteobacteria bacterium IMCC39524]|nr:hypothetical protein [Deltaproteobacteria bacterium IMCC39524]
MNDILNKNHVKRMDLVAMGSKQNFNAMTPGESRQDAKEIPAREYSVTGSLCAFAALR